MLLDAYQVRVAQIRDYTTSTLGAVWSGLGSWRDADAARFARVAVPKVRAAQIATARVTAQYLGGTVARDEVMTARKVDPLIEYMRPANAVWASLAEGKSLSESVTVGGTRLLSLVSTDVQLAKTTQARRSLQAGGYKYYRRVLSGSENCALCSIASTQRYFVGDLAAIHPGCDCGVEGVSAEFDPGHVIDPQFLEATHARVGQIELIDRGGRNPDYRKLIINREHGEIGPLLTWRSDHFTGPSDI